MAIDSAFVTLGLRAAIGGLILAAVGPTWAQTPPAPASEVHDDGRVTFRLKAPKASAVTVAGEWTRPGAPPNTAQKLTRDGDGVWSLTVGPLPPNIYIYVFEVDGVTIVDPINPFIKLRARTSASMIEVPGDTPWAFRDVPHGAVTIETHAAKTLDGAQRQIFVYTPPGYRPDRGVRYPILYLLHGNNDLAAGWTMAGRAHLIADNLLARGRARPLIIVMPWGHALPFGTRPPEGQPSNNDVFARYLLEDVVPLIEGKYRVAAGRRNRAIVGLSMGGAQALAIGLLQRDRFASIGIFGSGMVRADFDARFGPALGQAKAPTFDLLYLGVGQEDGVVPRAKALAEALRGHGLPVTYHETDGGHTYPVWRQLLADTLPRLWPARAPKP